jgi:hypothetical protein
VNVAYTEYGERVTGEVIEFIGLGGLPADPGNPYDGPTDPKVVAVIRTFISPTSPVSTIAVVDADGLEVLPGRTAL